MSKMATDLYPGDPARTSMSLYCNICGRVPMVSLCLDCPGVIYRVVSGVGRGWCLMGKIMAMGMTGGVFGASQTVSAWAQKLQKSQQVSYRPTPILPSSDTVFP